MDATKNETPKGKKIAKIVLNVLLWIFLAFAFVMMVFAFASISNDYGVPVMGNKVILNVVSDSMEPTIKKGDMLQGTVLSLEEKQNLNVGDIITFFADVNGDGVKEINTHRIVKKDMQGSMLVFRTKGDNDSAYKAIGAVDDGYDVKVDDIISVWKEGDPQTHGLGSVLGFLQSRIGFLCIVVIPLALFFIYEIVRFVFTAVKVKNEGKRVITAEDEEEIRRKAIEDYIKSQGQDVKKEDEAGEEVAVSEEEPAEQESAEESDESSQN